MGKYSSQSDRYSKGFKHQSVVLQRHWKKRPLYITEYDPEFLIERNQSAFPALPLRKMEEVERVIVNVDDDNYLPILSLPLVNSDEKYHFDWIEFATQN